MSDFAEEMDAARFFHRSYKEARHAFRRATLGMLQESFFLPVTGKNGEPLAVDIAIDGDADSDNLLMISSGCHGVEGFGGSGAQLACLGNAEIGRRLSEENLAILYIHALNPYGFSHLGRCTHENIDLNRNFLNFQLPVPKNEGYALLHPMLTPDQWPPPAGARDILLQLPADMDIADLKAILERGQYEFSTGLFYGGQQASWSNSVLKSILRKYARNRQKIAWIDIHTGLGAYGACERAIFARQDIATVARVNAWWNPSGDQEIASDVQGTSLSSVCDGLMWNAIYDECPSAAFGGITLEFGTVSLFEVLEALQAEQWKRARPDIPGALRDAIDRQIMDAFFCDDLDWKRGVLQKSMASVVQALDALSDSSSAG